MVRIAQNLAYRTSRFVTTRKLLPFLGLALLVLLGASLTLGAGQPAVRAAGAPGSSTLSSSGPATIGGNKAPASIGGLDWTFGTHGQIVSDALSDPTNGSAADIERQPDGKFVVAGTGDPDIDQVRRDFNVLRFNADGSMDTSFGTNGKVATDFFGEEDSARVLALQPDGKILAGGYVEGANGTTMYSFALARYNADGSPDLSFGMMGRATAMPRNEMQNGIVGMALQPDGKIVAVGRYFNLMRFNPDGSVDSSFGSSGATEPPPFPGGHELEAWALALQSDGKIVATGWVSLSGGGGYFYYNVAIARYNSDGSLDTTFGNNGMVIDLKDAGAFAIALQSDGKIVLGGSTPLFNSGSDFIVARYLPNGSPDTTFGSNGSVTTSFGSQSDTIADIRLDPSGRIVAAGSAVVGSTIDFAAARYLPNGTLDSTFGSGGTTSTTIATAYDGAAGLVIGPDGMITLAGSGSPRQIEVVQYTTAGQLNPLFRGGGKFAEMGVTSTGNTATAMVLQPDGKILTTGRVGSRIGVSRFNTDGSVDKGFGQLGTVTVDQGDANFHEGAAIALDSANRIVVADSAYPVVLIRLNPDGSLDSTFGSGGLVSDDVGGFSTHLRALKIQPDGKIVVGGDTYSGSSRRFILLRYDTNGSRDLTFGVGGQVETSFSTGDGADLVRALALQPDGKIVAAGQSYTSTSHTDFDFALARYNSDGSLDSGFGASGLVRTDFHKTSDGIRSIMVDPQGRIVAAGTSAVFLPGVNVGLNEIAVARYDSTGALDSAFGNGGTKLIDLPTMDEQINAVAMYAPGKIVLGGQAGDYYDTDYCCNGIRSDFLLVALDDTGALDNNFGQGGIVRTDIAGTDLMYSLAVQADGKIVAAGDVDMIGQRGPDVGLARYNTTEAPPSPTTTPSLTATSTSTATATSTATPASTSCPIQFTDVPVGSTFYQYVKCLACRNVLGGYSDPGRCGQSGAPCFLPNDNITRGQAAKIIAGAAGYSDAIPQGQQSFSDVPSSNPFWVFIERVYKHGAISGSPCTGKNGEPSSGACYRPGDNLTRGQLAKIATNAASFSDTPQSGQQSFNDVPPSQTFYLYIERAHTHNVISGYSCGSTGEPCPGAYFRPGANVTRGQAAKIVSGTFFPNCQTPAAR